MITMMMTMMMMMMMMIMMIWIGWKHGNCLAWTQCVCETRDGFIPDVDSCLWTVDRLLTEAGISGIFLSEKCRTSIIIQYDFYFSTRFQYQIKRSIWFLWAHFRNFCRSVFCSEEIMIHEKINFIPSKFWKARALWDVTQSKIISPIKIWKPHISTILY